MGVGTGSEMRPRATAHHSPRQSLSGFWRYNLSASSSACASAGRESRTLWGCPVIQACSPLAACLGNNTCATGYTGERCATCVDGYFLSNGACTPCPSSPFAVIIVFILAALGACALSYGLTKAGLDLPLISIGIDYAQVIAVFAQTDVEWPPQILSLYQILVRRWGGQAGGQWPARGCVSLPMHPHAPSVSTTGGGRARSTSTSTS